jgi:hypothetical protein
MEDGGWGRARLCFKTARPGVAVRAAIDGVRN